MGLAFLAFVQAAAEEGIGAGLWTTLIVAIVASVAGLAKLGRTVWTWRKVIRALIKSIEAFKGAMVEADDPDAAKALTSGIKANIEAAGGGAAAALARELAKAGANATSILGPAIAHLARTPRDGGGA